MPSSRADDVYTFVVKRQEVKRQSRWSLSDWLDTREKMRMQDLWLALHSPSPYEFVLGGAFEVGSNNVTGRYLAGEGMLAAYASIFGLEGHYEGFRDGRGELIQRAMAFFNLRVFGMQVQGTNMTFHVGVRQQNELTSAFRQLIVGGSLTMYLAKFFGVEGLFRYHFGSTPTSASEVVGGMRVEGGAFIDFSLFRVYGQYFWEPEWRTVGATSSRQERQGIALGGKFFL